MAEAASLSSMKIISDNSCLFPQTVAFTEININELAEVSIEDAYENNQIVYTTICKFQICDKKLQTYRQMAFRLTSINGSQFIIGTKSRPFPIMKSSRSYPDNPSNTYFDTVTITWKSTRPMLHIIR